MQLIDPTFQEEILIRVEKIQTELHQTDCDALLIASNVNIFYTTGRFYRGYVYIHRSYGPLWFIVKPQIFSKEPDIFFIRKPEEIPDILNNLNLGFPASIGLELSDLSYLEIARLQSLFPGAELKNGSAIMKNVRKIKTRWEIKEMKVDGLHQCKVYGEINDCYQPGMTDLQLQIEIERRLRLEGALGVSRVSGNLMEINMGSVLVGDNADNPSPYEFTMGGAGVNTSLPVGADNTKIKSGNAVMIDMNGVFNGYQTDMTRVWCLGELPEIAKEAHNTSIRILRTLEKNSLPGTPVKDMYETAIDIVKASGLLQYFMGHNSQVSFIGHGVGIELNELPVINFKSKDILMPGMTIAIEPKFVIPQVGAVGVENTYVVTPEGLENLTVFPEEIQKF